MLRAPSARICIAVFAILSVGCGGVAEHVRKVTYPPDFAYVPREKVQSAMWQLAAGVRELDQTLRDDALAEPEKRQRVVAVLERMESARGRIDPKGEASNHPLLERGLPRLGADISLARTAAGADPPRYVLAGAVSGACIYCHVARVPGPPLDD